VDRKYERKKNTKEKVMAVVAESIEEKKKLLNSLRTKYKDACEKYGPGYFSQSKLEERITHMMVHKTNLDKFLYAEFQFYQKLIEQAREEQEAGSPAQTETMDAILEEHRKLIDHYPQIRFSIVSNDEAEFFVGAVTQYYDSVGTLLKDYFRSDGHWAELQPIIHELEKFTHYEGQRLTSQLEAYAESIRSGGEKVLSRANQTLLLSGADTINKLVIYIEKILSSLQSSSAEMKLHKELSATALFNDSMNLKESLEVGISSGLAIIQNFRLQTFFKDHG
jgi:hypothetical protein